MRILVTGAAGFIGAFVCKVLLDRGHQVVGIDNLNNYYDVNLKYGRLAFLGIEKEKCIDNALVNSDLYSLFHFVKLDIIDKQQLESLFDKEKFEVVCNLAAQAGVRYSIESPDTYIQSNVVGFANILECCRHFSVKHLVYASSSSVYGMNAKIPFSEVDKVDTPVSLYAATKKSNELMAYTYTHLYKFATTGLRFFTVYGPWGRPDMSPILFANAIAKEEAIKVFNSGDMERDFTYIDDIVVGIVTIIEKPITEFRPMYKIYNIGNNNSVKLMDFIATIEKYMGKEAKKEMYPMQMGDVQRTWADVSELIKDYNYKPSTSIEEGIKQFITWYKEYYK
ncbi:NAD-dependent epimerase/dehydratase family protein [Capnocytophaga leadbetteri]|jgi:putative UDP-glucuronic acid epimerase|uniref:NAD-dependent epimerase/dehydratase family protein n=1 Tax=Capnocytophaga leadbetteri TaxID=327575 RepID=UPI00288BC973|nr:NAD-dependent epimerase/dehydratase family protein [Capnocytophaga leadbetteri]